MSGLLVIGAGGHGKVVADAAMALGAWHPIAFLDDRLVMGESQIGFPIEGPTSDLDRMRSQYGAAIVAVGDARVRLRFVTQCAALGFELPSIVHPSAVVSRFAALGCGCVVLAQSAVNAGARLGDACIVNTGATIDHDCSLAAGVHVCPGAHLAGSVRVGECTWIGIGASVIQNIAIGSDVRVAAGAVVVNDLADSVAVAGVPARPFRGK